MLLSRSLHLLWIPYNLPSRKLLFALHGFSAKFTFTIPVQVSPRLGTKPVCSCSHLLGEAPDSTITPHSWNTGAAASIMALSVFVLVPKTTGKLQITARETKRRALTHGTGGIGSEPSKGVSRLVQRMSESPGLCFTPRTSTHRPPLKGTGSRGCSNSLVPASCPERGRSGRGQGLPAGGSSGRGTAQAPPRCCRFRGAEAPAGPARGRMRRAGGGSCGRQREHMRPRRSPSPRAGPAAGDSGGAARWAGSLTGPSLPGSPGGHGEEWALCCRREGAVGPIRSGCFLA